MTYERVRRPDFKGSSSIDYPAILATAEHGDAVRIPLNGRRALAQSIHGVLSRRGWRVRTKKDGDHLLVWVEPTSLDR